MADRNMEEPKWEMAFCDFKNSGQHCFLNKEMVKQRLKMAIEDHNTDSDHENGMKTIKDYLIC